MADTGEDEDVTLDTSPIRGWQIYRVGREAVAPDAFVHFATDGDVRIPAQDLEHATWLADALTCVELHAFGSHGWLKIARGFMLRVMRWLNSVDPRTRTF